MAQLTDKQRAFIDQYFLCNMNGTEAVIQAGYKAKNRQTAASMASENLRKTHVRAEIEKRLEENTLSANQVLHLLTQQALGDIRHVLDGNGVPNIKVALANSATNLIKRWKKKKVVSDNFSSEEYEVELHDPQAAAVQLGRYHKLFTDKIEITDWETDAVLAIRSGEIEYPELAEEFGDDLATQLFRRAGVPVAATG